MSYKQKAITATAGVVLAIFAGCADLKNDLPSPVAPGVKAHGTDWLDTTSANFHGKVVNAAHGDVSGCLKCHGLNYQGGTSGVSCVKCHHDEGATLHGRGWLDPSSPNFHGNAIRAANWDMRPCQACHGALYDGGKVGVSCRDCHTGGAGPENCSTCHGSPTSNAPPPDLNGNTSRSARGVGAHQIHLNGSSLSHSMFCSECHITPGSVYEPGHIDSTNRARVPLHGQLVNTVTNESSTFFYDPNRPAFVPAPSYDQTTLKCSNTYCHGYFKNGNLNNAPTWNDTTGASGACGTCHGDLTIPLDTLGLRYLPKTVSRGGTHPDLSPGLSFGGCYPCHSDVVDHNFRIINPSKHINGKLSFLGQEYDF